MDQKTHVIIVTFSVVNKLLLLYTQSSASRLRPNVASID